MSPECTVLNSVKAAQSLRKVKLNQGKLLLNYLKTLHETKIAACTDTSMLIYLTAFPVLLAI